MNDRTRCTVCSRPLERGTPYFTCPAHTPIGKPRDEDDPTDVFSLRNRGADR